MAVAIDLGRLRDRLPHHRWFGGKSRRIDAVEIDDQAIVDDGPPKLMLVLARVFYADGGDDRYHLPLLVDDDGDPRDAFTDPGRLGVIGELMAHGVTLKGDQGAFRFGGPGLDPMDPPGGRSVRVLGAEQSNSSLVLDEQVIVKIFRRVEVGPNPDLELNRALTNEGFLNIPAQVGEFAYETEIDGEPAVIDLGIAQSYVGDSEEGWAKVTRELHACYDAIHEEDAAEDISFLVEQRLGPLLELLEELGDVTASFHVALSREGLDPDIAPEPVTAGDLQAWADAVEASVQRTLEHGPAELQRYRDELVERIGLLRFLPPDGAKVRIHGDYHLGQVLLGPQGWLIIDLEGEPARTLAERRAKQSPLKDVAGMLRSFSYAAIATLLERAEPDSDEWRRLLPWAAQWERQARARYLAGYLGKAHEGGFLPADRRDALTLLDVFELDKALYELRYERDHRPEWIRIPLRGIVEVIERGRRR